MNNHYVMYYGNKGVGQAFAEQFAKMDKSYAQMAQQIWGTGIVSLAASGSITEHLSGIQIIKPEFNNEFNHEFHEAIEEICSFCSIDYKEAFPQYAEKHTLWLEYRDEQRRKN